MRRKSVGILLGLLVSAGAVSISAPPAGAAETATALDLVATVNYERAAHGLDALLVEPVLMADAADRVHRQASAQSLGHTTQMPESDGPWMSWGENVGRGPSVAAIHQAFMNSPAHAGNIFNSGYTSLAVGIEWGGDGRVYVTELFVGRPQGYRPTRLFVGGAATEAITALSPAWYFAEGATWPGHEEATVDVATFSPSGPLDHHSLVVPGGSRATLHVNDVTQPGDVSLALQSDHPVAAMRSVFLSDGWTNDGAVAPGIAAPSQTWYLPEAYTGVGFRTYLALFNPGAVAATTHVTYLTSKGPVDGGDISVPPASRTTVPLHLVMPNAELSLQLASDQPVVAERTEVFDFQGTRGMQNAAGYVAPSPALHFAEGYTGNGFQEYLLVQNPDPRPTTARVSLLTSGNPVTINVDLPGQGRATVDVNAAVGANREVGATVEAPSGIVAERVQYFHTVDTEGGTAAAGFSPSAWSILPEGYVGPGFRTYVLLSNPGDADASVQLTYLTEGGAFARAPLSVPGHSRVTVDTGNDVGGSFGVQVQSDRPVVAEEAEYFAFGL